MKINFEQRECGRCHGAGRLSGYQMVMAGVCFGCGGAGYKLTKSGIVAAKAYDEAMSVNVTELENSEMIEKFTPETSLIVWYTSPESGRSRKLRVAGLKKTTSAIIGDETPMTEVTLANAKNELITIVVPSHKTMQIPLNQVNVEIAKKALNGLKGVKIEE
jgi:hypothetical protein